MLKQFNFCLKAFNRNFKFSSFRARITKSRSLSNLSIVQPVGDVSKKVEWCSGSKSWSQGFALAIPYLLWFKPEAMKMRPNNCIVTKINYRLPYELNCRLLTSKKQAYRQSFNKPICPVHSKWYFGQFSTKNSDYSQWYLLPHDTGNTSIRRRQALATSPITHLLSQPNLAHFALELTFPASSTECERGCSSVKLLITSTRNRLDLAGVSGS